MSEKYVNYTFKDLQPLFKSNFDIKNTIRKKLCDIFQDFFLIYILT
jgi:hypothetical protein